MWGWIRSAVARLTQWVAAFLSGFFLGATREKLKRAEKLRKAAEDRAAEAEADATKPDSAVADELYKRADRKD